MSRLKELFEKKSGNILNIYCTAGFPEKNSTLKIMKTLQGSGVDIIELGIPYSDPLADGPVIQESSMKALKNGMSISELFLQLENMRQEIHIPVVLMGYMNTVLQFGFENFCKKASESGIDGIILPDLPLREYETEYKQFFKKYNLDFIFLITPQTSDERIKLLDEAGTGFIYAVSSSSTTGKEFKGNESDGYFNKLKNLQLKNPVLIGFGISDKESFRKACSYSAGAIIGTAYIKAIQNSNDIETATKQFISSIIN